ncbi:MAG: 3-deoxy-D-manno-octulosonic acid transferase [Saprospiraceae bacterium]|nr:MAG: 3-deoxy-D-manno-octulosonic acid transferase [Saprospiraceae bacterium]
MVLLYRFITWFYFSAIRVAAIVHPKARQWAVGRRGIFTRMEASIAGQAKDGTPVVWMHCASLGEFEQGRPVLENLKKTHPRLKIFLTFFSPSGYEMQKNYPGADWVFYLPDDTPGNARRFLQIVQPSVVIFVKYEFWYFYLVQLKSNRTPALLIAASFRPEQPFFKWYGGIHRRMLDCFTSIFVQNELSRNLLTPVTQVPVTVAGDTRIDRVLDISKERPPLPLIQKFCGSSPTLVCGSTWPRDEKLIARAIEYGAFNGWKIIIAPHEVNESRLVSLENRMKSGSIRYSAPAFTTATLLDAQVLVIDCIGILSHLYRFARVAYVGGGCQNSGIHNTLEPGAFGIPLIFGRNYKRFPEAVYFVNHGGAFAVEDGNELCPVMAYLADDRNYERSAEVTEGYLKKNKGATAEIISNLKVVLSVLAKKKPTSRKGSQLI